MVASQTKEALSDGRPRCRTSALSRTRCARRSGGGVVRKEVYLKAFVWFLGGLVSLIMGLVITLGGMVVLGWRRHGAGPLDFTFLHLDWIFQPELPFWKAHMANLTTVLIGLVLVCGGIVIWIRLCRSRLKPKANHGLEATPRGGAPQP